MTTAPFIEADLQGFFPPDFEASERVLARLEDVGAVTPATPGAGPTRIHDARALQREAGRSEAAFFGEHGFVLLSHPSAVTSWDLDPSRPAGEQDVVRVYHPEVEALVRERLLPGRRLEIVQAPLQRRGPGSPNPEYGAGVHQDYGLTAEDYAESLEAFAPPEAVRWWRSQYERDEVEGYLVINFWRPVYATGPLVHMPLAVCEPRSVRLEDCVPFGLLDFAPTGRPTNQLALRRTSAGAITPA